MTPIEIPDSCEFIISEEDKIKLQTQTNGDTVTLYPNLTKEQAATLAYLANVCDDDPIRIEIKRA